MKLEDAKVSGSFWWRFVATVLCGVFCGLCIMTQDVYAVYLPDSTLTFYNENGILYYDPCLSMPSGGGSNSSGSNTATTVAGNSNEEKIWNWFVNAGIPGVSDNAKVIAGIMGNIQQESGFNPFATNGTHFGLFQNGSSYPGFTTMMEEKFGSHWGESDVSQDIVDQAIIATLEYVTTTTDTSAWQNFLNGLSSVEDTPTAYAKLFENLYEISGESALAARQSNADAIYARYGNKTSSSGGSSGSSSSSSLSSSAGSGTANLSKIMQAKNADKQSSDFAGAASWDDNDPDSIKYLLESYGDLAYQAGKVAGVPWTAILVQMRYEDPNSVCGTNNLWGNGCDPSHAVAGGATIQASNLGEGFQQYVETLTNGYHDQALGISDPAEFLRALGPTWVQGNINGPGYSSIDAMINSLNALLAYLETDEGKAIVEQFGNYTNDVANEAQKQQADACNRIVNGNSEVDVNPGEAAAVPMGSHDAWLFPDGIPTTQEEMAAYLTTITVPIIDPSGQQTTMQLTVHKKLAEEITAVFEDLMKSGFKIKAETTACYVWKSLDSGSLSKHAWGAACDINWNDNGANYNGCTAPTENRLMGCAGDYGSWSYHPYTNEYSVTEDVINIWEQHGFYWGGYFGDGSLFDPMHFSFSDQEIGTYDPIRQ